MKWLLALYPAAWRARYREEVETYLEQARPPILRTTLDLLAGAIDARLNPREIPVYDGKDRRRPTLDA